MYEFFFQTANMCFKRELRKQEVAYFGEPEDMPGIAPDVLDLPGVDTIAWFFHKCEAPEVTAADWERLCAHKKHGVNQSIKQTLSTAKDREAVKLRMRELSVAVITTMPVDQCGWCSN